MNPKVSIIIPVYNSAKDIVSTLDSLTDQTYSNIEIICVDDGSTDDSVSVVESYIESDPRITLIRQKNQYAGIARNNGLANATGDYVMFLDSDDLFEKNMVSHLVKKAVSNNADIVVFGYWRFVDSVRKRRPVRNHYKDGTLCSPESIKDDLFQMTRSLPWDKFLNMDFVRRTGLQFQGTKVNNDVFFNRTIVTEADKILFLGKRFVNYRINNSGSLQGKLNKNPTDFITAIMGIYDELNSRGSLEVYRKSFDRMILSDILAHLRRVNSFSEFEIIGDQLIKREVFDILGISKDSNIMNDHPYKEVYINLIEGDNLTAFYNLYAISRDNSIGKDSAEYRIGHKLMEIMRLTY